MLTKGLQINTPAKGLAAIALDGATAWASGAAIGYTHHRYSDKWAGKNSARIAAIAGKGAALVLSYWGGGHQTMVGNTLNSVGQAGLASLGLEWGLNRARKATGKRAVLLPTGAALPPGGSEMVALGELGRAPAGRGLSWDQIEELARGH